jgi:hypothetical protein
LKKFRHFFKDPGPCRAGIGEKMTIDLSIYEGTHFVLFCNYEIHRIGMLQIVFIGVFGKLFDEEGCMVPWHFGLVVQKFLNIE